jgi:type VI protein secretion system component VasK
MVVLGLLVVLLAVGAGAAVYVGAASLHGTTFTFDLLGAQVSTNPLGLALSGALVVLVFWLGWAILRLGARRAGRRRRAAKEAERQAETERAETEQRQREELAARERAHQEELAARERAHQDEPPAPPPPPGGSAPTP